jgi:lysozyme
MDLIEQISRDEGRKARIYQDTVGKWTGGVGRNLSDVPFTDDEIDLMLANDIKRAQDGLSQYQWFMAMDSVRQAAMINMAFNIGVNGLLHFPHMIAALAKQDWTAAAAEMANSQWAHQVGDRATRLEQQIVTGEWV